MLEDAARLDPWMKKAAWLAPLQGSCPPWRTYTGFGGYFVGTKGKVCVDRGRFKAEPESLMSEKFDALPTQLYRSNNHYKDFVDCIRSRKRPICDVEVGARSVTVCHLGNLAYWHGRKLKWDPAKERFVGDEEANTWLDVEKRGEWKV